MCIFTQNTLKKCDKRNNRDKYAIANVAYFDFDPSEELYREFGYETIFDSYDNCRCGGTGTAVLMWWFDAEPDVEV